LLFVYGTLRPFVDIEMARWLRGAARYLGSGVTRGRLYDLGAYPGMKAGRASERVVGDVYLVGDPSVLRVLDRYEAGPSRERARFVRERCLVKLDRGGFRIAWVYRYRRSVVAAARIASGDYRSHRESRAG
jgi:gamma-glutamylcyclotransferase (GGCT)/AIG2-like uncharacterized protein YtfP